MAGRAFSTHLAKMTSLSLSPLSPEAALPTLLKLGNPTIPDDLDVTAVASSWLSSFAKFAGDGNVDGVLDLLITSSFAANMFAPAGKDVPSSSDELSVYWRDLLALTWDFRTFEGTTNIKQFLEARLKDAKISNVQLRADFAPRLQKPFPDLVWIQLIFTFDTNVGLCTGIARLVPVVDNGQTVWKAQGLFTNLEGLKGFPEKVGALRDPEPNHGKWEAQRKKEVEFEGVEPTVLIIGGGHSGLDVAVHLKALGVSNLVIEKNPNIGDNWRGRYEALCLHDTVWYDQMPYLKFPETWPVFAPARKLAKWLEQYVETMELNVWTSSTVTNASQDPTTKNWNITVLKRDGTERIFHVKHLVMATGFKGGQGYVPIYPGMDSFKGQILHSLQHRKATDHSGKKVVVIGSCTSAHDVCVDYVDNGVDVTMFQRSSTYVMSTKKGLPILLGGLYAEDGPPTDIADRLNASMPNLLGAGMAYRATKVVAEADKDTLDGLQKRGFRLNDGYKHCGLLLSVWQNAGGYYMDVGGSQYIIDGKIKLKNDSQIKEFTEHGLRFEDGSELPADVVLFCTGLSDPSHTMRKIIGDEMTAKAKPIWGLTEEGELKGCYGNSGIERMWNIMGNLALCRFYSKHLSLQIKAMEEGLFGERYSSATA